MATKTQGAPIAFCATGVFGTLGGIASANRNVASALSQLATAREREMRTYVLNENGDGAEGYQTFAGRRAAFALAALQSVRSAGLTVFDHVRISLPMLALPRAARGPVVVCAHGSESWKRMKPASITAFRAADLVLTNSLYTLNKMQARFGGFAGAACPLGLPPQFALTPAAPERRATQMRLLAADGAERQIGARAMLLVARMDAGEQQKGHRELIEALPAVLASRRDAQAIFVGAGSDMEALRALAAASPAASHVFFTGPLDNAALEEVYAAAYAYVMPSRQEGFGLAYLEAMNHALPCVACRDDGGAEVVVDGETGLLIEQPINLDELAQALTRLLSDEAQARTMGVAGWRRLHAHYSAGAHQKRVLDLVAPLLR